MEAKLEKLVVKSVDASTKYLNNETSDDNFNELIDDIMRQH